MSIKFPTKIGSINRDHTIKTPKQMERHFKGISNSARIEILIQLLKDTSVSLDTLTEKMPMDYKNISQHMYKLVNSGLVSKQKSGPNTEFILTPYGKIICDFIEYFMYK